MNNAWHGLMEICIAGEGVGQRDILSQCSFSLFRTVGSDPVTNSLLSTEILWWAAHWKRPEKLLQKPNSGRHAVHLLLSSQCNSPGEKQCPANLWLQEAGCSFCLNGTSRLLWYKEMLTAWTTQSVTQTLPVQYPPSLPNRVAL